MQQLAQSKFSRGREFQMEGAATPKARCAGLVLVLGTINCKASNDPCPAHERVPTTERFITFVNNYVLCCALCYSGIVVTRYLYAMLIGCDCC